MKSRLKLTILLLAFVTTSGEKWMNEVQAFLRDNGFKYVTLVENSTAPSANARKLSTYLYERAHLYLRHAALERYAELHHNFNVDFQIFLFDPSNEEIDHLLKTMQRTKVKRSILLIKPWKNGYEDDLRSHLEAKPNIFFFMAHLLDSSNQGVLISWQQVLTLETGCAINDIKFIENSFTLREDFDLKGLKIRSIALSWPPFLTINDCNDMGTDCAVQYGYLMDYIGALAKNLNFTLENHIDQARNLMVL